jgi:hypothetical protein
MKKLGLFAAIVVLIALWLSTLALVPRIAGYMANKYPSPVPNAAQTAPGLTEFGLVGDMFGAVSSLFSALALGAVALTLWIEVQARRRSRQPFVVASPGGTPIIFARPSGQGDHTKLPFKVPLKISNQTEDAALGVLVEIFLGSTKSHTAVQYLDGPLLKGNDQTITLGAVLAQTDWRAVLDHITRNEVVPLRIVVKCKSLEGVNWTTEVVYNLKWRTGAVEQNLLNSVRGDTWSEDWTGDAEVALVTAIQANSWKHYSS